MADSLSVPEPDFYEIQHEWPWQTNRLITDPEESTSLVPKASISHSPETLFWAR